MTSRQIASVFPDLNAGRISELGIDSLTELSALAAADPEGFAIYFHLQDARPLIRHLQELLNAENGSFKGPFVLLPPGGVPFEHWPPINRPALSSADLAERDRLVEEIKVLETLPANDAEVRKSLVGAMTALHQLLYSRV